MVEFRNWQVTVSELSVAYSARLVSHNGQRLPVHQRRRRRGRGQSSRLRVVVVHRQWQNKYFSLPPLPFFCFLFHGRLTRKRRKSRGLSLISRYCLRSIHALGHPLDSIAQDGLSPLPACLLHHHPDQTALLRRRASSWSYLMDLLLLLLLLLRLLEPAQSVADGDNGKKTRRGRGRGSVWEPNEAHNENCRYCEIRRHFITNTDVPVNESAKVG